MYTEEIHRNDCCQKPILVVTSVAMEKEWILRGVGNCESIDVLEVGVGSIAASIKTTMAFMQKSYGLVVSAGIGGGFRNRAPIGTLAIADTIIAADLGAETKEGFLSLDQLGLGATRYTVSSDLVNRLTTACRDKVDVVVGPILTLSTVTGTEETTHELMDREPTAVAEAMEGFGVAQAAVAKGIPMLEIRAISNDIGLRQRESWRIEEALDVLSQACAQLREVFP